MPFRCELLFVALVHICASAVAPPKKPAESMIILALQVSLVKRLALLMFAPVPLRGRFEVGVWSLRLNMGFQSAVLTEERWKMDLWVSRAGSYRIRSYNIIRHDRIAFERKRLGRGRACGRQGLSRLGSGTKLSNKIKSRRSGRADPTESYRSPTSTGPVWQWRSGTQCASLGIFPPFGSWHGRVQTFTL